MAWEGRGRASIREPGDRLRHRSTDLTRDEERDEPESGVTIWFLSHAETDLLALRSTIEDLPVGLGPVRVANPAVRPEVPEVAPGDAAIVRLLGGRPSWDGFDALRERCRVAGVPF